MQYIILSIFRSLLCVFLFRLSKQLIPPIPPVQVQIPFSKNKEAPNLYDISLTIQSQSITLPINLFSNVTLDDTVPAAQIYSKIKNEIPIGVRYVYKQGQYTGKDDEEKDIDITEEPTSLYGGVNKVFAFFVGIVCFCGIFALIYSRVYFLRVAKVQELLTIE